MSWNFDSQRKWSIKKAVQWKRQGIKGANYRRYKELFEDQGSVCAICQHEHKKGEKLFALDHDHDTGEMRGVLCHQCNTHLGWFDKDDRLTRAVKYLRKHKLRMAPT